MSIPRPTLTPARLRRALLAAVLAGKASRLAHEGKTVSVRLALRLAPPLAGERLRLAVAAVDRGGLEQLERRAGPIRVAG